MVVNHIKTKVFDWYKEKAKNNQSSWLTAKDSNFFEEIKQTINTLISSGASIEYCKKIE